jgi:hypothetical protein
MVPRTIAAGMCRGPGDPDTFRQTNRPTFQQVLELTSSRFGPGR